MLMEMRFFSPPSSQFNSFPPRWRSQAYSFLIQLIGMNGPTCAAIWARPPLLCGSCPPRPPCRSQSGRLMAPVCEVCLRKWPLILSGFLLVFSTDRPGLSRAPNCTVKTHRAAWCITVDAHGPRETPPISLHCGPELLMKIRGHFGAPSLA